MIALGEIVRDLVSEVATTYGKEIFYDYGHPIEIINNLAAKTNGGKHSDKYPMIALFLDADETENLNNVKREATINLVIVAESNQNFSATERTTEVFNLVLIPIFEALKKNLTFGTVIRANEIDFNFRYSWGKTGVYGNTANIFNDFVDAIEIKNLKIEILKTC